MEKGMIVLVRNLIDDSIKESIVEKVDKKYFYLEGYPDYKFCKKKMTDINKLGLPKYIIFLKCTAIHNCIVPNQNNENGFVECTAIHTSDILI